VFPEVPSDEQVDCCVPEAIRRGAAECAQDRDFGRFVPDALACVSSGFAGEDEPRLRNALLAYHSGMNARDSHLALAGIGFFAALASFASREEACPGTPECAECKREVRHLKTGGEVERVVEFLETGPLAGWGFDFSKIRRLLKRFHGQQRSAFVHAAQIWPGALPGHPLSYPMCPTKAKLRDPAGDMVDQAKVVQALARVALLWKLAPDHPSFSELLTTLTPNVVTRTYRAGRIRLFDDNWRHVAVAPLLPRAVSEA